MLSCNCLNVIIETENDFEKLSCRSLDLTEEEGSDIFFNQEFQKVGKLININKVYAGLIQTRNVGPWIVNQCLNCDIHTHALHKEKGAASVLVYSKLLNRDEIENLRNSELYSKAFRIIVPTTDSDDRIEDLHVDSYLPKELQHTIRGFKEITTEVLKKETIAVEERIKKFAEQQYTELENLKDKTFREQEALIRTVINKVSQKTIVPENTTAKELKPTSNPAVQAEPPLHKTFNLKISDEKLKGNVRHTPQRQKSSPGDQSKNALGYEALFDFDTGDEIEDPVPLSDGEEDCDDDDEENDVDLGNNLDGNISSGRQIPKGRGSVQNSIAYSLPITIPISQSQLSNHNDEEDCEKPIGEQVDIAASMRELTRSVQGDAIFGELPKPRFRPLT